MNIIKTAIESVLIIEPKVYQDERGYFFESFNANEFSEKTGMDIHDKRIYLAEYNRYVEETITLDRDYNLIICIMRDVTDEESERKKKESLGKQTIEITDNVVNKQMRIVQEIASLLGETTAETKIALTKLKESIIDE